MENNTFSARGAVIVMAETMQSNLPAYSAGMMPLHAVSMNCTFTPSLGPMMAIMSGS